MSVVTVTEGISPVILAFPHAATDVPPAIWERLNENGRLLADTDWYIDVLYGGLDSVRASTVRANFHRYVIDANRDPGGGSLYPGQNTTDLVPKTDFDGGSIWREGEEPTAGDTAARLAEFYVPYHAALAKEVERVKSIHGVAVIYDCHSIRSRIPFLFDGVLPDFNIGTNGGVTCASEVEKCAVQAVASDPRFTSVLNGRFKGGWTTRHYGKPAQGVHAIQMELAQSTYLSDGRVLDPKKAESLRARLKVILETIEAVTLKQKSQP